MQEEAELDDSSLLDLIRESVVRRDLKGRILSWNMASEHLYGWRRADVIGRLAHDILGSDPPGPTGSFEAQLLKDNQWQGTLIRRTATGREIIVEARWSVRRNRKGEPIEIVETSREAMAVGGPTLLTDSERRYCALSEALEVSFWELDFSQVRDMVRALHAGGVPNLQEHFDRHPNFIREMMRGTQIVDLDDRAVRLFGTGNKPELLGDVERFWPDASSRIYAECVVAAFDGKPHHVAETRMRALDGHEFDVLFTACFPPEFPDKGTLLVGMINLSDGKRSYAALEEREFRYRNLFHKMAMPFQVNDVRGLNKLFHELRMQGVTELSDYIDAHPEFVQQAMTVTTVIEVNEARLRLVGATDPAQIFGPVTPFFLPDHYDAFRRSIEAGFRGQPGYQTETKAQMLDGRVLDVLFTMSAPPDFRARGMALVCMVDISEWVRAREMLQQVQAEFAHAARISMLGELTASIAHEVNQPLAAIATSGEASLRWLDRAQPDLAEVRTLASRMVADARRAADIIAGIRAMATRRRPKHEPLVMDDVIEETMLFLRPEIQRQGVEVQLDLAPSLPRIVADRVQLQQVVVNLAVNAIQAMCEPETLQRRLVVRTSLSTPVTLLIEIEDTGPGIAPDHAERFFKSFFTTKATGMGIGLTICRSIIEAHGGAISVMNRTDGRGARVSFTLPADVRSDTGEDAGD